MSAGTKIEWTEQTWNPLTGCTRVSEGCDHCYIERTPPFRMEGRRFDKSGIGGTTGVALHPDRLKQPLRWRKPRRVFVNSLSDLFHADVPAKYIAHVFAVMAMSPRHTFQVLTKRPARMRSLLSSDRWLVAVADAANEMGIGDLQSILDMQWPLPNVWLGVSVESQQWMRRIDELQRTPAAVRWVSAEPLLGPLDLCDCYPGGFNPETYEGVKEHCRLHGRDRIDWVVAGGESGPGARPMHPDWALDLRDQCVNAGVPYFFKQWGEHDAARHRIGKKAAGRLLDGRTWDEYPEVTS